MINRDVGIKNEKRSFLSAAQNMSIYITHNNGMLLSHEYIRSSRLSCVLVYKIKINSVIQKFSRPSMPKQPDNDDTGTRSL